MNAVNIKLHGHLGSAIGEEWSLHVASASEAMNAINVLSKRSFFKYLIENDKKGAKYKVLINGREFLSEEPLSVFNGKEEEIRNIRNSELCLASRNLKTIDVIPVLEGADAVFNIIAGIVLIVVGIVTGNAYIVMAGIGLLASGITALLMEPPSFEEVRGIQGGGTASYLFSGPQNVVREGGPIPLGYGELLVGSQVLGATYVMSDILATQGELTS